MNPDSLYGGLSAERFYTLPKFPTSTHTLRGRLIGGTDPVEIAAENFTGTGDSWTLLIPAASLATLAGGTYALLIIAVAITGGAEQLAAKEAVKLYASTETDLRSDTHKMLDALNAMLLKKATRDQASMSYNGRSISRMTWPDLLKARDTVARQLKSEESKLAGRKKVQTVNYRFPE